MKKIIIIVIAAIVIIGVIISGGYYWHKKQNEPPPVVVYQDITEVDNDIARFEPLYKAGKLRWQDMYLLGVAYMQKGRVADAAKILEEVVKLHPNFYKTYESLGMAYYRMDDIEKAVSIWEKVVKMSPQTVHLEDMINKGKQRIELKKRVVSLEQEMKQGQVDWQKKFELAILYIATKRVADAKTLLEDVLKTKKDSAEVYDVVAQAYAMSNDFEKAVNAEKKAVKLKPKDENFKKRLAEMERVREGFKKGEYHKNRQ